MSRFATQRPWWFVLVAFWWTIPPVIALAVGYAIGHRALGAMMGLVFVFSGFGFSHWVKANEERQRDDRLAQAFAVYFGGMAVVLALIVIGSVIVERG